MTPSQGFRYSRRVQFSETDLAGIAHFSAFFRFMEEAEHALWRAAGLSIGAAEKTGGWPRVAAAFDYKRPLRFEDEFEVTVCIAELTRRSIRYSFTITSGDALVGTGSMPGPDGKVSPEQRREADVNIEFQMNSKLADESQKLAWAFKAANDKYATDYPATVGPHMITRSSVPVCLRPWELPGRVRTAVPGSTSKLLPSTVIVPRPLST